MSSAVIDHEAVQDSLPVRLHSWVENSHGLVSLWQVLYVHAITFNTLLQQLKVLERQVARNSPFDPDSTATILAAAKADCNTLQLTSALKQFERIEDILRRAHASATTSPSRRADISSTSLSEPIRQLRIRVEEDLEECVFLKLSSEEVSHCFVRSRKYETTTFRVKTIAEFFGEGVQDSFQSAAYDMAECCFCYFTERSTACVFHLMRILEVGLRVLADKFNIPSDSANWHNILEGVEKQIRGMASDPNRSPDWKIQQEIYSEAAVHFMFIKNAWRNHAMHARDRYNQDEAKLILDNVRGFMQKLAIHLHE